jgi:HK97 family phage major capsid protein
MSIQNMRDRRNALALQARELLDQTKDKKWENEHQSKYDELTGQVVDLDSKIEREQKVLDMMAEKEFRPENNPENQMDESRKIFNSWMRGGEKALSAEEQQKLYNTMSTTTPSEGGYTVPSEVAKKMIESLKDYGGMRSHAEVIVTSTGNPLSYPTTDGTAEEGELLAENASSTNSDITFGTFSLNVFKYGSKDVAVPVELLQDSVIDVEALVFRRLVERLGRITNKNFTTGAGTSLPMGIVTASSAGKVGATGTTVSVGYDDLVDLLESVDQAYLDSGNCKWMFSQTVRKLLRKLKDTANRPIWTPGYEYGIAKGVPDQLLGHDVAINNQMAVPAANAKSIIFGDLSKYKIRDAMNIQMMRFTDSAYAKKGQVGFLAFLRSGGGLSDTAAVKHFQHSAT